MNGAALQVPVEPGQVLRRVMEQRVHDIGPAMQRYLTGDLGLGPSVDD